MEKKDFVNKVADLGEELLQKLEAAWKCPQCGAGVRVHPSKPTEGILCYCDDLKDLRRANLPDHGTTANPCHDARCGDCNWKGTIANDLSDA